MKLFSLPSLIQQQWTLGFAEVESLAEAIGQLLHTLDVPRLVALHCGDRNEVLAHTDEMLATEREGNNLRDASIEDIRQIVETSLEVALAQ